MARAESNRTRSPEKSPTPRIDGDPVGTTWDHHGSWIVTIASADNNGFIRRNGKSPASQTTHHTPHHRKDCELHDLVRRVAHLKTATVRKVEKFQEAVPSLVSWGSRHVLLEQGGHEAVHGAGEGVQGAATTVQNRGVAYGA